MNVSQHLVPFMVTVTMIMIMLVIMDVLVKAVLTISVEDTTLTLLVVGYKAVLDELSGTVGMKIVRHVIALLLHVVAQLVEGRCRDHMALTVDLPSDGGVLGADLVASRSSGGGSSIVGQIRTIVAIDNHGPHHVRVEILLIVHDGKDLRLDADGVGNVLGLQGGNDVGGEVAEHPVVEGSLVLIDRATSAGGRVGPMDLVSLANLHALAMLPFIRLGELLVLAVVVVAAETGADLLLAKTARSRSRNVAVWAAPILVVLADGIMLGTKMPVDVDGAHG